MKVPPATSSTPAVSPFLVLSAFVVSALLIVALGQFTDLDLVLADRYWDTQTKTFPLLHHWFTEGVIHGWLKYAFLVSGAVILIITIFDYFKNLSWLDPRYRHGLRLASIAAVLISTLVSTLKKLSFAHCPWNIDRYGGYAPYVRIFDPIPLGVTPGGCMPAGHATSALWIAALCLIFWPRHKKRGAALLFLGLFLGLVFGWSQQMRGAHFFTHTLWSIWITCAIIATVQFSSSPKLR